MIPRTTAGPSRYDEEIVTLKVLLEPSEEGGYTALVPGLPGCISEGESVDGALANIREAIESYREPSDDDLATKDGTLVRELVIRSWSAG